MEFVFLAMTFFVQANPTDIIKYNYVTTNVISETGSEYDIFINHNYVKNAEEIYVPVFLGKKIEITVHYYNEGGLRISSAIINLEENDIEFSFAVSIILKKYQLWY